MSKRKATTQPWRKTETFDAPRDYEVNGQKFFLVAPNDVRVASTIKNHNQDYPILFNKLREMIKDIDTIDKDADGLPIVNYHKYTELLLNAFNALGIKWRTSDKLWIKNPDMITSVPYIKIYPEKQVGTAKSGQNYDKLKEKTIKEASMVTQPPVTTMVLPTPATSIPAPPTVATMQMPPAPPTNKKSRNYNLSISTKIIAFKKKSSDKKFSLFVVDENQNAVYDFQQWKRQTEDYDSLIEEPGPVGFIKGPDMPEALMNWKKDRDNSFLNGETQMALPGIYNNRGYEIGELFFYKLKKGYELEFFPEPESEEEEISLKRITYSRSRSGNPRTAKTYLKATTPNSNGNYDIYADDDEQTNIGEMDDDGDITFDYQGYDSEDDKLHSTYPYEILTTYQVDKKVLKQNELLQKESKKLNDDNLGINSMGGFWEVGWSDTWDAPYYFNTTIVDDEGDNAVEKHYHELQFYKDGVKDINRFLTQELIDAGWIAKYSTNKMATYYLNKNLGKSQYNLPSITSGGKKSKRRTRKNRK